MISRDSNPLHVTLAADKHLPSLDGWRAFSIVMVLGWHCTYAAGFPQELKPIFSRLFDGDFGVRIFFIISGFLITRVMIGEHNQTGQVSLKNFYIRRALRILPVYFSFLAVLVALQMF